MLSRADQTNPSRKKVSFLCCSWVSDVNWIGSTLWPYINCNSGCIYYSSTSILHFFVEIIFLSLSLSHTHEWQLTRTFYITQTLIEKFSTLNWEFKFWIIFVASWVRHSIALKSSSSSSLFFKFLFIFFRLFLFSIQKWNWIKF
jgi:hypothetical protein